MLQPCLPIAENLVLCLKISQPQWIDKLSKGNAWFGKIDNYIEQANRTGNTDQGDAYEGVFAHCEASSSLVKKYQEIFGDDLEIIPDGDYVFLRRYSSRDYLALCMFGIKNTDLKVTSVYEDGAGNCMGNFHYDIPHKMYDGFLQDGAPISDVAGYYCSAGHFIEAIETALNRAGLRWKRSMVSYDIELSSEFLIEPNKDYQELQHKRKELQYQHELRFLVPKLGECEKGISLEFAVPSAHSGNCAMGELYIEGTGYVGIIK